ncbi:hypothetical protein NC651_003292 [Populus alba x Populus x berolinensis]|nr:hypothetical protein NC651_003292 [Populus alba x Populus x berolinensis]
MLFPRRRHPGFAICPFEILLKVEQVQWRRMNTIRIFNNTAMLAGEIKSTSAYGSRSRIKYLQKEPINASDRSSGMQHVNFHEAYDMNLKIDDTFGPFGVALKDISQTVHKGTLRNSEILKLGIKEHSTTDKQARNLQVTAITEMKLYEISRTIHDSLGSPQKLCNRCTWQVIFLSKANGEYKFRGVLISSSIFSKALYSTCSSLNTCFCYNKLGLLQK